MVMSTFSFADLLASLSNNFSGTALEQALATVNQIALPGGAEPTPDSVQAAIEAIFGPEAGGPSASPAPSPITAPTAPPALTLPSGAGGAPAAAGFDLFADTFDLLLRANDARRAEKTQLISLLQLITELERVSPTRAAGLAAGVQSSGQFDFTQLFGQGGTLGPQGGLGGFFSGAAGGQEFTLPGTFSGSELSFLNANPNVARVIGDIADFAGRPDIFQTSIASLIPTSGNLARIAA